MDTLEQAFKNSGLESPIRRKLNQELLKWSCSQQIFCNCGAILDCGSATLIQVNKVGSACLCPACAALPANEKLILAAKEKAEIDPDNNTYLVGAELFKKEPRKHREPSSYNVMKGFMANGKRFNSLKAVLKTGVKSFEYWPISVPIKRVDEYKANPRYCVQVCIE